MDSSAATPNLIAIPLVDTGRAGPLALLAAEPGRFRAIFNSGESHYGPGFLRLGDRLTRRWLDRADTPYAAEMAAVARESGRPGADMLNLSYEWSCTSAVGAPPSGRGNRLLRTLDWPLNGLGRNVVVARHEGDAGPWFNVTWPGFVGVATGMAPGRFAAAINQPPMKQYTPSCWLDWAVERAAVWRRHFTPPVHLLRRVFETARDYDAARRMLTETPIAMPAFFSLSGVRPGEGCVIERTATAAYVRDDDGRASIANHWIAGGFDGRLRGHDSPGRYALMEQRRDGVEDGFDWVVPPILNPTTRLAVTANAGMGTLEVRGYEATGPVTRDFRLGA